ncbi:DgyrCDS11347 [Dimorphilus gyrociliatus]|uniref:FERM domain-containing protein 8 n=1 Tax=Dimorphilus gyrociliatus TaxID=2664684 RepID=A0A7I8W7S2_9ANNE|nr:DgyrCDS11347 [Dimorphilus gyrociliatus]
MDAEIGLQATNTMTITGIPGRSGRLPPLRTEDFHKKSPRYNKEGKKEANPEIQAERRAKTTVSIPSFNHSAQEKNPGLSTQTGDHSVLRSSSTMDKPMEIVVYFSDKTGISLNVDDGVNVTAMELFDMVYEETGLPNEGRETFSLWLMSNLLELQLKPSHVPFRLAAFWEDMLEEYTGADDERIDKDEPILMFQRNVFCTRKEERAINDTRAISLLFHEAKENVIDGRYPLKKLDDYHNLAALQSLISHEWFDAKTHTPEYFKTRLNQYYPEHLLKKKWSILCGSSKDSLEDGLVKALRQKVKKLKSGNLHLSTLMVEYLDWCRDNLPFYGGAFFAGQIVHPRNKLLVKLFGQPEDPVYIAINMDGVFVIDMDDVIFLLGILYKDLKWEIAEKEENKRKESCLFLQFDHMEKDREQEVKKLLQIFSREANLMDALICASVNKLKTLGKFADDGGWKDDGDDFDDNVIMPSDDIWEKLKSSLSTFSKSEALICAKTECKINQDFTINCRKEEQYGLTKRLGCRSFSSISGRVCKQSEDACSERLTGDERGSKVSCCCNSDFCNLETVKTDASVFEILERGLNELDEGVESNWFVNAEIDFFKQPANDSSLLSKEERDEYELTDQDVYILIGTMYMTIFILSLPYILWATMQGYKSRSEEQQALAEVKKLQELEEVAREDIKKEVKTVERTETTQMKCNTGLKHEMTDGSSEEYDSKTEKVLSDQVVWKNVRRRILTIEEAMTALKLTVNSSRKVSNSTATERRSAKKS